MLATFRWVAYLEGISFLLLLGVAMPLKYAYGQPLMVQIVGWIHGILFTAYAALLATVSSDLGWPARKVALGLLASVLPFGPFVFDRTLRKHR